MHLHSARLGVCEQALHICLSRPGTSYLRSQVDLPSTSELQPKLTDQVHWYINAWEIFFPLYNLVVLLCSNSIVRREILYNFTTDIFS